MLIARPQLKAIVSWWYASDEVRTGAKRPISRSVIFLPEPLFSFDLSFGFT